MDMENILFFISLGVLIYMIVLNAFYSLNLLMAAIILPVYNKRYFFTKGINIDKNISKSFSILVPAYNEEKTIVDSVNSLLSLDYKNYEVVVANDGSKDKTLDILISTFEFVKVDVRPNDACESKPIKAVYFSRIEPKLVLVDKENGGKPDAQNGAARVARFPYICMVDADTLLDKESLNDLAIRFTAEPNIVALGGIIRVANGCTIENGIVINAGMPRRFIEKMQVLEYLRAFLFGRVSLAAMKALMIISGAFGVFRWDAFMLLGGWNREAIGEDMDAVIRLQRIISEKGLDWKVDFIPDPVSWTQVPMTWKSLGHQRERWQRGLMQVMLGNLKMLLNPRYGAVGLVGFPYFAIFEMLSAAVEFLCYPLTIMCFAFGIVNVTYMVYFLCLVLVWGLCISFFTIIVQEDIKYRYGTARDLKALLCIAVFENFGYRQIHSFWRLWGMMKYIFIKSSRSSGLTGWTSIPRAGFME
ncbi:glycosyltransferase family 2 protein [Candidatus Woesebacteria bacterium]|nr:MAG: glycosyltransferase family 2 protein [Candidatus Woesebacteria bacterium]